MMEICKVTIFLCFFPHGLFALYLDDQDEVDEEFVGTSKVEIIGASKSRVPFSQFSNGVNEQHDEHPLAINFKFHIPKFDYSALCECMAQSDIFNNDFQMTIDGRPNEQIQVENCNYFCRAHFNHTEKTSKCFFSVCHEFKEGIIWIPDHDDYMISLEFAHNQGANASTNILASFYFQQFVNKNDSKLRSESTESLKIPTIENLAEIQLGKFFPNEWLHIELMVFVTYEAFSSDILQSRMDLTLSFVNSVMSLVNAIYAQLKIHITLQRVEVWQNNIKGKFPVFDWDIDDKVLYHLGEVMSHKIRVNPKPDYLVCIRNINADSRGGVLGYAWHQSICKDWVRKTSEGLISNGLAARTKYIGKHIRHHRVAFAGTIAHELAHALGFAHFDENNCQCPTRRECVMSARVSQAYHTWIQFGWSDCAIKEIYKNIKLQRSWGSRPDCLKCSHDHFGKAFNSGEPICGNGIIETGEECDCGPQDKKDFGLLGVVGVDTLFCDNSKCCSNSCKLKKGAQCTQGICCNSAKCDFYSNNTICRVKEFECDVVETCNGSTSVCPADRRLSDGSKCFAYEPKLPGRCLGKQCVSHDKQCKELLGETSRSPLPDEKQECLDKSAKGRRFNIGECGNLICVVVGNNKTNSIELWKLSNGLVCLRPKFGSFGFVKPLAGTECEAGGTCSYNQRGHFLCQNSNTNIATSLVIKFRWSTSTKQTWFFHIQRLFLF